MKTRQISLFYQITQTAVLPASAVEIARKDAWIKEAQKSVEADWKPKTIKVTYSVFDPEIENQRRFFEGPCVLYYAIQDMDLIEGTPDSATLDRYRETLLDNQLGYNYQGVNKLIRKRESTSDFKTAQKWNQFLHTLEETDFESAGYEFPDSEKFWNLVKEHGYEEAKGIVVSQLQNRLGKKLK